MIGQGERLKASQSLGQPWHICPTKLERLGYNTSAFIGHWLWTTLGKVNLAPDSWRLPEDGIPSLWTIIAMNLLVHHNEFKSTGFQTTDQLCFDI